MSLDFVRFLTVIAARTALIFLMVVVGLRVFGKRQMGQMNIYDLAMLMALGNAVQNAMTMGKGHLSVGIVSAGTLFLIGVVSTWLFVRNPVLETRIVGMPTVLFMDGEYIADAMRKECVDQDEIHAAMRQHGITDPKKVRLVVLEVDGGLSVVPVKEQKTADGGGKNKAST